MYRNSYKLRSGTFRVGSVPTMDKLAFGRQLFSAALSGARGAGSKALGAAKGVGSRGVALAKAHPKTTAGLVGAGGLGAMGIGLKHRRGAEPIAAEGAPGEPSAPSSTLSDLYSQALSHGVPHFLGGAGLGALASHALGGPKWLGALGGGLAGYLGKDYINNALGSYTGGGAPQA